MIVNEPMSDKRLAQLRQYAASGNLGRSEAEELVAEVDRLRARIAHLDSARDSAVRAWKVEHDGADDLQRERDQARTELAESLDALTVAAELIDRLTDNSTCDYDHHDNCRAHSLQRRPCPHPLGRQFVEAWRAVEAEQKEEPDDGQ